MERIKHIKETQNKRLLNAQTGSDETGPLRDKIEQIEKYNPATEITPEQIAVREILNTIDESMLKEIFEEYFRKTGSDEKTMNWISFDNVRIVYESLGNKVESKSSSGSYSISMGIELYSNSLWHDPEVILWSLIHEQCHAISQGRLELYDIFNALGEKVKEKDEIRSGVSFTTWIKQVDSGEEEKHIFYNEINEGITELLTERIYREYKRRTGSEIYRQHPTKQNQTIKKTDEMVARRKFNAYARNWKNIKLYISIISAITDISEDVVEDAVIRTYIRNGYIIPNTDPEVNAVLSAVYPELSSDLHLMLHSRNEANYSLNDFVDYLTDKGISEDIRKKIVVALHKIREEWGEAYKICPYSV